MNNTPSSPLDTLRQLKEMLDAGALTPAEFDALKQRLVLNPGAPLPPPATPAVPVAPISAVTPPVVLPPAPVVEPPAPVFEKAVDEPWVSSFTPASSAASVPLASSIPPTVSIPEPLRPEEAAANPEEEPEWTGHEFPAIAEEVPARNPLALVLSIGGVLIFLAVVAYLTLNRPASEHLSSTSQTAADSVAAPIETGPQAELLPATAAAPETIRVAPAHPAPVIPARPTPAASDSAAAPVASDSADSQ